MKEILIIMKKEFVRFFTDKRLWINALILPGLLIYCLYSLMGGAFGGLFETDETYVYSVYVYEMPDSLSATLGSMEKVQIKTDLNQSDAKQAVSKQAADLVMVFPEDFDTLIAQYNPASGESAPNVELFYNSARTESMSAFQMMSGLLNTFESAMTNKFDVNRGDQYDLASEKDMASQIFSTMLPMLMLIFLYSGCMAIAPDSIAGEKERGTLATMLVTPMKRSSLAIGKICSLGILALLSGISSFLGTILSLPKLMNGALDGMNASVYGAGEYLALLGIILSTALLFISVVSVISAYSKNVKEASTYLVPFMAVVMLCAVFGMFGGGSSAFWVSLIPVYNSVAAMKEVFSFAMIPLNLALTIASNLVYSVLLVYVLTRMFKSERMMFNG